MERWHGESAAAEDAHQRGVKSAVFLEEVENVSAGLLVGADQLGQQFGDGPGPELVKVVNQPMKSGIE